MSAPTEALAKFWEDLRAKSRVQLDHPDLPDELKAAAAETIAVLWRQASTRAREELGVPGGGSLPLGKQEAAK